MPPGAQPIFHHRDDALDERWGEGTEVTLYRYPDGSHYLESYTYHVDWDGRHDAAFVSLDEAIETVARHGGAAAVLRLFPDSAAARWQQRYGVCGWYDLADHLDAIVRDSERVFEAQEPRLTVWAHPDALWIVETVNPTSQQPYRRLERSRDVLAKLRKAGCPGRILRERFGDSLVVQLLDRFGVAEWAQAEREHLPRLVEAASPIARTNTGESGVLTVWRLDEPADAFLARREHEGRTTFNALEALHAAELLARMDLDDAAWRAAFPEPARTDVLVRQILQRAGLPVALP